MCPLGVEALRGNIPPIAGSVKDDVFPLELWRRKQEVSLGSAYNRHRVTAGPHIVVESVGFMGVRLSVERVRNMFNKSFSPSSLVS